VPQQKICSKCKVEKPIIEFSKKGNPCKLCAALYAKQYRIKNSGTVYLSVKRWKEENPEQVVANRKKHYERNRKKEIDSNNQYRIARKKIDPGFRILCNLRSRIVKAIKRGSRAGSSVRDMGCTGEQARVHLESQFKSGWTWENYGTVWSIDHIIPLSSVDLENDREGFLRVNHYTNLRPLSVEENSRKGARLPNG